MVHSATLNFSHRRAAKSLFEPVLQRASAEAGGRRKILDVEVPVAVLADETEGPDDGGVIDGQNIGGLPLDGVSRVHHHRPGRGSPSGH